jgi:hypothetical protein
MTLKYDGIVIENENDFKQNKIIAGLQFVFFSVKKGLNII